MKKEIKAELVAQAVIGYILLLLIVLAIYLIFALLVDLNIFSKQADQSTILTNLFIWSATLYTPFLAYMAYSDWKEQKHYDVVINTLNEMVDTVNNLSTEIDSFRGKSIYEPLFNKLTKITKHAKRHFWLNDICTCHGLLPSHSA